LLIEFVEFLFALFCVLELRCKVQTYIIHFALFALQIFDFLAQRLFTLFDLLFITDNKVLLFVGLLFEFCLHLEDLFLSFQDSVPLEVFCSDFSFLNNKLGSSISIILIFLEPSLIKKGPEQQAKPNGAYRADHDNNDGG